MFFWIVFFFFEGGGGVVKIMIVLLLFSLKVLILSDKPHLMSNILNIPQQSKGKLSGIFYLSREL